MQKIPFSLAQPGMILARDVIRADKPNGPPICGKGLVLTESLIERLANLEVQSITVHGNPLGIDGVKTLEEDLESLERRFRLVSDDPLAEKLKNVYRDYLVRTSGD